MYKADVTMITGIIMKISLIYNPTQTKADKTNALAITLNVLNTNFVFETLNLWNI